MISAWNASQAKQAFVFRKPNVSVPPQAGLQSSIPTPDSAKIRFSGRLNESIALDPTLILDLEGKTFTAAQLMWHMETALKISKKSEFFTVHVLNTFGHWDQPNKEKIYRALEHLHNLQLLILYQGATPYLNDWVLSPKGKDFLKDAHQVMNNPQSDRHALYMTSPLQTIILFTAQANKTALEFMKSIARVLAMSNLETFTVNDLAKELQLNTESDKEKLKIALQHCQGSSWIEKLGTYPERSGETATFYALTEQGKKLLESPAKAQQAVFSTNAVNLADQLRSIVTTNHAAKEKSEQTQRIARFKALLSEGKEGLSGWKLLQGIYNYTTTRSSLSAFFSYSGYSEKTLTKVLNIKDPESLSAQLTNLQRAELLRMDDSRRWYFTDAGVEAVRQTEPAKACKMTAQDYIEIVDQEIQNLESDKQRNIETVNTLSGKITEAPEALAQQQAKYQEVRLQVIQKYDAMTLEQNTHQKDKLQLELSDLLFKLKIAEQEVEETQQAHTRQNHSFQRGKAIYLALVGQINSRILTLHQMRLKLKNSGDLEQASKLAKSLIEVQEARKANASGSNSVLDTITDQLYQAEATSEHLQATLDKEVNPIADELLNRQALTDAIQALRHERDAQKADIPAGEVQKKTAS